MCELNYDYSNNKYGNKSRLVFIVTDTSLSVIKTEDVYEDFSKNKEMLGFNNYSAKSKYYDHSNKLVFGKMRDETGGFAIEKFIRLYSKMYSF